MQRMPILSDSDMSLFELKTRFTRNYLTFAGKNSKDFLLYISGPGVYDSTAVDLELQTIPGKNGDLIRDNAKAGERRYKNLDISYDAFFFDAVAPRTAAVKSWLLSPARMGGLTPLTVYHVMSRGNRRSAIFLDESDYINFLELDKNNSQLYTV